MVEFKQLIGIAKKTARESSTCSVTASQRPPQFQGESNCQQGQTLNNKDKDSNILQSSHGNYEVISELGKGVYGKVMKCREVGSQKLVAVKVLNPNPRFLEAGKKELQFLSQLREARGGVDHIVRCVDWFEHSARTCIVFELLGQTLEQLTEQLRPAPLPLAHTRHVLQQLLSALQQLEIVGIVHADVKPDNIMVANDCSTGAPPQVKLIDFSCAVATSDCGDIGRGAPGDGSAATRRCCAYAQTRHFRAPEVLLGAGLGAAADVWSLGCVAGGLLLGRTLFPGASEYDQLRFICAAQGAPALQVARGARRAGVFFRLETTSGRSSLALKSEEEVEAYTGRRQILNETQRPLRSLDELGPRHVRALARGKSCEHQQQQAHLEGASHPVVPDTMPPTQLTPAAEALHLCVGLIKSMLDLDQTQRIRPVEALAHPFFVLPAPAEDQPPEDYGDFSTAALIGRSYSSASPSFSPSSPNYLLNNTSPSSASLPSDTTYESTTSHTSYESTNESTTSDVTQPIVAENNVAKESSSVVNNNLVMDSSLLTSTLSGKMFSSLQNTLIPLAPSTTSPFPNPIPNYFPTPSGTGFRVTSSAMRSPQPVSCAVAAASGCPILSSWARRGRALSNFLRPRHDSCPQ